MSDPTEARRTAHRRVYEGKVLSLDVDEVGSGPSVWGADLPGRQVVGSARGL